jgi:hypothetical protein
VDEREPFAVKVGTASFQRLEKDLPPKEYESRVMVEFILCLTCSTWAGNHYVPYKKGERFQILDDNMERMVPSSLFSEPYPLDWYKALRLNDGTQCLLQKNLFSVKEESMFISDSLPFSSILTCSCPRCGVHLRQQASHWHGRPGEHRPRTRRAPRQACFPLLLYFSVSILSSLVV